jgi:hypothetical protein
LVLRHEHRAGEKLFVDYAGATVPIYNAGTDEVWQAAIFVAVLGRHLTRSGLLFLPRRGNLWAIGSQETGRATDENCG